MTADNPNIADLSDIYRPTNIADQIRQVYDDEWTEAYEELENISQEEETGIIDTLASILKVRIPIRQDSKSNIAIFLHTNQMLLTDFVRPRLSVIKMRSILPYLLKEAKSKDEIEVIYIS